MKKILTFLFLGYLRFFAKIQLKKINPIIIGIGGASGKTSVAQLISVILSKKYKVKQGKGKNSETGIPLNILGIEIKSYDYKTWLKVAFLCPWKILTNFDKYDYLVVEMGIDSPFPPKNMEYLLSIIKPNIGLLTNINLEHSLYFDELVKTDDPRERKEEILALTAKEEGKLLKSIPESGRSFINLDDLNISTLLPLKSKTVTISVKNKSADFYISDIQITESNFSFDFYFLNERYSVSINSPLPKFYAYSLVFPIAVSFSLGFSIKESIEILQENFSLPPGRFSLFKGIKNTLIIDSSYNSSLEPVRGAIEALSLMAGRRRKVAILGDMRELGLLSKTQHQLLAKEIIKNLDFVILIGPMMKSFVAPMLEEKRFKHKLFETFKEAKEEIGNIKKDDIILVKGSQNKLFLERAVEMLLENKEDKEKLCRRGKFWDSLRSKA